MRKLEWAKKLVASAMLVVMVGTSIPTIEANAMHGTATEIITEDMLIKKAPKDYEINWDMQADASEGLYSRFFLKDSIQTVSVTIDENNFNYLLQNALEEPYMLTDSITIGDETIQYAGIKTKGNWTLQATNDSESDRFSFTVNFGKFIKKKDYGAKQNFYGLAKVSFNNLFLDKTAMKEYTAMKLMDEMGLPTPEYGIAKLYINGDFYGVYFMVEAMDKTILERHLETDEVTDYVAKPTGTKFIYDTALDAYKDENGEFTMESLSEVLFENEDGDYEVAGALANSAAMWEEDDDMLQDIAEMMPTILTWQSRLNLLSEGKDFEGNEINVNSQSYIDLLEEVIDVDEMIRYFATHSFIVQQDNMFGNFQNYGFYLGEDGRSMLLPWDYDLGWGGYFDPMTPEDIANNPLTNLYPKFLNGYKFMTEEEVYSQFPLFNVIYQNKKLMKRFEGYMEDCAKIATLGGTTTDGRYFEAGRFANAIDTLYPQIIEAALEPMPSNVFYLNGAIQPRDMAIGMIDLKNLIAKRSVGVYSQVNKIKSTVTGCGVDCSHIGNGITGKYYVDGTLTVEDAETGIFAVANYGEEGNIGPRLDVTVLDSENEMVVDIVDKLNTENVTVYSMTNTKEPESIYELYLPTLSDSKDAKKASIYAYSEGKLTELKVKFENGRYMVRTDDISCIVVTEDKVKADKKVVEKQNNKETKKLKYEEPEVYIVGNEDMGALWWLAYSEHYEIPTNSTTVIEFENYSPQVDIWDNFVTVFTNESATHGVEQTVGYYQEYAVVRADDFGWGTLAHTLTYSNTHNDWAKFQEILKAAKVTMTIERNSSYITVHEVVTSLEDPTMSYERTYSFEAPNGDLYATMVIEGGYLKINSIEQEKHDTYKVGKEDMSTIWWTEFSEHYELEADATTVIEFENYSAEVDLWDNFVSVFTNEAATAIVEQSADYQEYAVIRADDFGWGTMGHTLTYSNTHNDWAKFQEILKAANVTMTITREGANVTVHELVTSIEDPTMSYERTVTFEATAEELFITLTIEGGYLMVNSVVTE